MNPPLIEIRDLTKHYRRDSIDIPVLDHLSLTIREGEFVALMGPSGSGKTTLLNLIAGIDRPDRGEILVGGLDITTLDDEGLARYRAWNVGFIFQLYNLMPVLTALENVELPLLLTPLTRRERRERAALALSLVGLGDRLDHYPRQLSGGQEQRVAIARAVVSDPALIVADEPTGDLDGRSAEDVLSLMERLNGEFGKTVVMVTHDPKAASHARRLLHLEKGVLLREEGAA